MGKSRLAPYIGRHRPELARAMALDTVQAALACAVVDKIIAVTDDPDLGEALDELGATIIPDEPDAGLNPAVTFGATVAREIRPTAPVAALSADLPALRPTELEQALRSAQEHDAAFVSDAAEVGTTLYCVAPGVPFRPQFGANSRTAHALSGAFEIDLPAITSVRHDVDTEADLVDAVGLGIARRTREVLAALGAVL